MNNLTQFVFEIILMPLVFLLTLITCWIPMFGWNLGICSVFPEVPKISYWEAYWITIVSGWIIHRPRVSYKN